MNAEDKDLRGILGEGDLLFRTLVENSLAGIYLFQDERVVYVNSRMEEILGRPAEEIYRLDIFHLIHPEDREMVRQRGRERLEGKAPPDAYTFRILHPAKGVRWVLLMSERVLHGGRPAILGNMIDLTEQKEAEEKYRILVEHANEAIVVAQDGMLKFANPKAVSMLGFTRQELISRPFLEFIHPEDRRTVALNYQRRVEGEDFPSVYSFRLLNKEGGIVWVEIRAVRILWEGRPATLNLLTDITERVRAEEALRERERFLDTLMSNLPGMVYRCRNDRRWTLEFISQGCLELTGYTSEQLLGDSKAALMGLIHPEDRAWVWDKVHTAIEGKRPFDLVCRILRSDGKERWVGVRGRGVVYREGEVEALEGFISDVSDLKRSLEEMERSKALFEGLFWGSPDAIAILDRQGRIIQVDPAFEELFQYSQEEAKGVFIWDLIAPADRVAEEQDNHRTVLSGRALKRESVRKRKDGSPVEVSLTGYPIRVGKEIQGIYAIYRDITAQKRAEQAFRESESRYRELVDHVPVGIYDVDITTGRLLSVNRALGEITGYSREELLGLGVEDFVAEESTGLLGERRRKILAREEVSETADFVIRRKDGQKRLVRVLARVTYDNSGRPKSKVVMEDVTEQKRLEAQFLQAQKMEAVGRLAGGVAHDINNALTGVLGYADLILTSLERKDPIYAHVEEIKKAARRASSTIHQLLTFSRRQIIHPRPLNLNRVIRDLVPMLSRLIGEDIRLETFLASEPGTVRADKGQIEQILMNLAVNSRDAMPEGGTLTIETADVELDEDYARGHGVDLKPGPYVMLSVSDTGVGMDEETRRRIFEPFFTTKAVGEGTGLGLSTVYGIVKQSRGYIWVYSEPAKGTTFKIYLPPDVGSMEGGAEIQGAASWEAGGDETILVVEDEEPLLGLVKLSLERGGYRVLTATTPQAALGIAQLHSGPIHLLVTDVVLPGMNGRLLAEAIRVSRPDTKVLYMSGYTENTISHRGILDPEVEFLAKPFTPEELARKVREVLDKIRQQP